MSVYGIVIRVTEYVGIAAGEQSRVLGGPSAGQWVIIARPKTHQASVRVMNAAGKAEWLRFEGLSSEFTGFEFAVKRGDVTEWYQTKSNAPNGNWTINALKRENLLSAFKRRLESSSYNRCVFVY